MLMSETDRNARLARKFACHEVAIRAYVRPLVPSRSDWGREGVRALNVGHEE